MAAALHDKPPLSAFENFCYATLSPMVAGCVTNPAEVARVRLQVDTSATGQRSSVRLIGSILRNEGFLALYKGMQVTWLRDGSKGFFRLGLYDPLLTRLHPDQSPAPIHKRLMAGAAAGATGAFACNPFDVVKTKIQVSTAAQGPGIWHLLRMVVARDGVSALYRGSGLSMLRSVIGNSTNLTVFTLVKEHLIDDRGFQPGLKCDVLSAMTAGFASSIAMNPVEVLRTRVYNAVAADTHQQAPSIFQAIRHEGLSLFRKGLWPAFLRQGPHFSVTLVTWSALTRAAQQRQEAAGKGPTVAKKEIGEEISRKEKSLKEVDDDG